MGSTDRTDIDTVTSTVTGTGTVIGTVASRTPPPVTDRVRVTLISEAAYTRYRFKTRASMNDANVTNRALQIYDAIDTELHAGAELLLVYPGGRVTAMEFIHDTDGAPEAAEAVEAVGGRVVGEDQRDETAPVTLTSGGAEARDRIAARHGFSADAVTNQALQVYDTVDDQRTLGATIVLRYPDGHAETLTYT